MSTPVDYNWPLCSQRTPALCVWAQSLSCVQLLATPWNVACLVSLSMGFPRQEYWSGVPFPAPRDLPNLGVKPESPALAGRILTTEPPGKPAGK